MKVYYDFFTTNEGKMATLKSYRVSNSYLCKLAMKKLLNSYIVSENFSAKDNWITPFYEYNNNETPNDSRFALKLSDKSLADCVEALIGLYLIHLGVNGAKSFIQWLDFTISDKEGKSNFLSQNIANTLPSPLLLKFETSLSQKLESKYSEFEKQIGYVFSNKVYLMQAFTHPSDIKNVHTSSYQKLELVGDAVLDLLITQYIFGDKKEHSPGELTSLRQSLVNNKFFGHLSVKHNFPQYMCYQSQDVFKKLSEYCEIHRRCSPDIAYLNIQPNLTTLNDSCEDGGGIGIVDTDDIDLDPPKFLADLFESVAGAIYLDSNCSLNAVWNAYYSMIEPYLETFKLNPPQSPIKALDQLKPNIEKKVQFSKNEDTDVSLNCETICKLTIEDSNFEGRGCNKMQAKANAYKKAVKFYDKEKAIVFF